MCWPTVVPVMALCYPALIKMVSHLELSGLKRDDGTGMACLQASSMSKEAAESAQHRLRGLDAPYVQALAPKEPEKPSAAVLAQYGITSEFMDFVRSLTYSTFRDFPADALPAAKVIKVLCDSSVDGSTMPHSLTYCGDLLQSASISVLLHYAEHSLQDSSPRRRVL